MILGLAISLFAATPLSSRTLQNKPAKSDANINAIGHRDVGKGLDFYTPKHEKQLGAQLAKEIEKSAKFVADPAITGYIDRIGQLLARNSDARMPVNFRAIDTDVVGAFTVPGGINT